VFVLGQRFDFATFNVGDNVVTKGSMDESGKHANLQEMANNRSTPGMFGSGYIEMLARQMTVRSPDHSRRHHPRGLLQR
jgi:hypothetical protein